MLQVLISPGALDEAIHISLPDCKNRCAMWSGLVNGHPCDPIDVLVLCKYTEGYSGAEVLYNK